MSDDGWAFPEFIKDGYGSCKGCHYDSSGGGPLSAYGRTIAEEKLSIWSRPREGEAFYGWFGTHPFGLAGDLRHLYQRYEDDSVRLAQSFPMQREISITFDPAETVSFVASAGLYGFDAIEPEYRRYYGKITLKGFGLMVGRFMPAFGINIPDHTKATKAELFGQGKESLNAEVSYTARHWELFATRLLGRESGIKTGSTPSVLQRDDSDGLAIKASLFPFKGGQIGASIVQFQSPDDTLREYASVHVFLGTPKAWIMGEVQNHPVGGNRLWGEIGLEPIRGIWTKVEINETGQPGVNTEVFGTLQLFPRPHFEFSGSVSRKQVILITHWYI
jgi:hypothetical protein